MIQFVVSLTLALVTQNLSDLCDTFNAKCLKHLSLRTGESRIRGVFADEVISPGTTILEVPLAACLRDDQGVIESEQWAVRLASCLLQSISSGAECEARRKWLDLLPTNLSESLPIHWDESVVRSCLSPDLDLAVDLAYFARADAVHQLVPFFSSEHNCHYALDIVQTRSCRVDPGIRLLAPIFDFLNHGGDFANAEYLRVDDTLVVKSLATIQKGCEVLIDYGASARPDWRCLLSYGFVPIDNRAFELTYEGVQYTLTPTSIPYDLVESISLKLGQSEVDLTPGVCSVLVEYAGRILSCYPDGDLQARSRSEELAEEYRQFRRTSLLSFIQTLQEHCVEG